MRPPRQDIAAPPFPPESTWIGGKETVMERMTDRGPVLAHFFDFAQLNSLRTFPYLREWDRRYGGEGLQLLGIHTSRFPFTADPAVIEAGVGRLEIDWPIVVDDRRMLWDDYGCRGWPSLFLWSKGGALRWAHFGEGEYLATEEVIREELDDVLSLPEPMEPLRPGDAPGALVAPPTPEVFPGGSPTEPWRVTGESAELAVGFAAAGAWASVDGSGAIEVTLDGEALPAVEVPGPGLYQLTPETLHTTHEVVLRPSPEIAVYSVSFAAAPVA